MIFSRNITLAKNYVQSSCFISTLNDSVLFDICIFHNVRKQKQDWPKSLCFSSNLIYIRKKREKGESLLN